MSQSIQENLESFYAALRNLNDLELQEFRNVIKAVLKPTLREKQLTVNYHRATFNVEMMLSIKDTRQFQTTAMLARAIFELAVEMKLINHDKDASHKIALFMEVEKLKAARRLVAFKRAHPNSPFHYETHETFIEKNGSRIDAERAAMWPPGDGKKDKTIKHWTTKDLMGRATSLGEPFDRIYHVHYAELSWMTHSGASPMNINNNWVTSFVGVSYAIAMQSYEQILEILVNEFKMYNHDALLKKKIICSRELGFTSTDQQARALRQRYGV